MLTNPYLIQAHCVLCMRLSKLGTLYFSGYDCFLLLYLIWNHHIDGDKDNNHQATCTWSFQDSIVSFYKAFLLLPLDFLFRLCHNRGLKTDQFDYHYKSNKKINSIKWLKFWNIWLFNSRIGVEFFNVIDGHSNSLQLMNIFVPDDKIVIHAFAFYRHLIRVALLRITHRMSATFRNLVFYKVIVE